MIWRNSGMILILSSPRELLHVPMRKELDMSFTTGVMYGETGTYSDLIYASMDIILHGIAFSNLQSVT